MHPRFLLQVPSHHPEVSRQTHSYTLQPVRHTGTHSTRSALRSLSLLQVPIIMAVMRPLPPVAWILLSLPGGKEWRPAELLGGVIDGPVGARESQPALLILYTCLARDNCSLCLRTSPEPACQPPQPSSPG